MTVTLADSYDRCRQLSVRFGTTYHWATYGLPRVKRHHVWALYAFCRSADDIVDALDDTDRVARSDALAAYERRFFDDWNRGTSDDAIFRAVVHTVHAFGHDRDVFRRFLRSMTCDLSVRTYETWDDLLVYMDGSAAVIGEMMLPILEPTTDEAVGPARDLGLAFQLTNFLRDVGEDLGRGRIYIPLEDLQRFGADPMRQCVDRPWMALMRFEIARCRRLYESADRGIAELPPRERRCIGAARNLYSGILDRIVRNGYDVFHQRARVPQSRKVFTALQLAARSTR